MPHRGRRSNAENADDGPGAGKASTDGTRTSVEEGAKAASVERADAASQASSADGSAAAAPNHAGMELPRVVEAAEEEHLSRESTEKERRIPNEALEQARTAHQATTRRLITSEGRILIARYSPVVSLTSIVNSHRCSKFVPALTRFLASCLRLTRSQVRNFDLPFGTIHVYSQFKLIQDDDEGQETAYTIKASHHQQDTVIVMQRNTAESAGLRGK